MLDDRLSDWNTVGRPRVLVLGDAMLDIYVRGDVERVSPEAAVLVLRHRGSENRLGGAANVAYLVSCLGADAMLAGVVGDDERGTALRALCGHSGIDHRLLLVDDGRPTTAKSRYFGRSGSRPSQPLLRVDDESTAPLGPFLERRLGEQIQDILPTVDGVLVSDYGKGVCSQRLLALTIARTAERNLPLVIDPARGVDYHRYRYAAMVTPNRHEAEVAAGQAIGTAADGFRAARCLVKRFGLANVLVTLDRDGMVLASAERGQLHVPATPRELRDVCGAGDTVLATMGVALAGQIPIALAVQWANLAAGMQVEREGTIGIRREELLLEQVAQFGRRGEKTIPFSRLESLGQWYRACGLKVVLANGCFDLLHVGHVAMLEAASRLGEVLVVAVNSDRSVQTVKGPGRPVICEQERLRILEALECVDHVVLFDEPTPHDVLRRLRPDVLVKGGNYEAPQVVGSEIVQSYGGTIQLTDVCPDTSTTRIITAIRERKHTHTHGTLPSRPSM